MSKYDIFREAAITFEKTGKYCPYAINTIAGRRYWREQTRRCIEGYDVGWDRITGYHYFYLNFSPIPLVKYNKTELKEESDQIKGDRVTGFPEFRDGDYKYFHYIEQAEKSGKFGSVLKTRGAGYSLKGGSMLCRNYFLFPGSTSYAVAFEKEYLTKDGLLTKAWDIMAFVDENTAWTKKRHYKDQDMHRRASYRMRDPNKGEIEKGFKSEIIGITLKDDPDKIRGKRGKLILFEEAGKFPKLLHAWNVAEDSMKEGRVTYGFMVAFGCVCAGTKVWTNDGRYINIEDLKQKDGIIGFGETTISKEPITYMQPPALKECVKITTSTGRTLECSIDHPILIKHRKQERLGDEYIETSYASRLNRMVSVKRKRFITCNSKIWREAELLKKGDTLLVAETIDLWGNETLFDARLVGMLIGDGSYGTMKRKARLGRAERIEYKCVRMSNCDDEINEYISSRYNITFERGYITKDNKNYKEYAIKGLVPYLKEIGIAGQSKENKRLPINHMSLTKKDTCELLAGLFDTDGSIIKEARKTTPVITLAQLSKDLLEQVKVLLEKLGITSIISEIKPNIKDGRKDIQSYHRLTIARKDSIRNFHKNIPLLLAYKQERLNEIINSDKYKKDCRNRDVFEGIREESIISVEKIGLKEIYNLTAGNTHTYLANNIITHNTGGTENANFMALNELFNNPDGYNIAGIDNEFENNGGRKVGFFHPASWNYPGCQDEDGKSDIERATKIIKQYRDLISKNSKDPTRVIRRIAENPLTPTEAMMKVTGDMFPTKDLQDRLSELLLNPKKYEDTEFIGELKLKEDGSVYWEPKSSVRPIREFPHIRTDDRGNEGGIVIYEHPMKRDDGSVYDNVYIAGMDPYEHDESTTMSLGCLWIMNRITNRIVLEYTGRPDKSDTFYENCRRALKYYNARCNYENNLVKGVFNYFDKRNCLYLLCDTPKCIVDKIESKELLSRPKGTPGTTSINRWGRELTRTYLMTEIEKNSEITFTQRLRTIPFIKELLYYNSDDNFDRISAFGMMMILREELSKIQTDYQKAVYNMASDPKWNALYFNTKRKKNIF